MPVRFTSLLCFALLGCGRSVPPVVETESNEPVRPVAVTVASKIDSDPERLAFAGSGRNFLIGKRSMFVCGRNVSGKSIGVFAGHFKQAAAAGEKLVRVRFTSLPLREKPGEVDPDTLAAWDAILDSAEENGLGVMVVLADATDWNDREWNTNPYNAANGGPAKRPSEIFEDTECRRLWLKRLEFLVQRWTPRKAVVAWELMSEIDQVAGAVEDHAVTFVNAASGLIRKHDPGRRPIAISQVGFTEWPKLYRSPFLDFLLVNPSADGGTNGRLDEVIIFTVRQRLAAYGRPVFIGECDPGPAWSGKPRAEIGARCAFWASLVSGAMNSQHPDVKYADGAAPVAAFAKGLHFFTFAPVNARFSDSLRGGVIGTVDTRVGWVRDARCVPPAWPTEPTTMQSVTIISESALSGDWRIEFFDTKTGLPLPGRQLLHMDAGRTIVPIPDFRESIAFKMTKE